MKKLYIILQIINSVITQNSNFDWIIENFTITIESDFGNIQSETFSMTSPFYYTAANVNENCSFYFI